MRIHIPVSSVKGRKGFCGRERHGSPLDTVRAEGLPVARLSGDLRDEE